jgi:hypothetical protein
VAGRVVGFAGDLAELAGEIRRVARLLERDAAAAAVAVFRPAVYRAVGGDRRMSGVGRGGAAVEVTVRAVSDGSIVRVGGPFHLLERATRAHEIVARSGGGLVLGGGSDVRRSVSHPGTRGKGTWAGAEPAAAEAATKAMAASFDRSVK